MTHQRSPGHFMVGQNSNQSWLPYLGTFCWSQNCQEPFPQIVALASLSTSLSKYHYWWITNLCVFSRSQCLPLTNVALPGAKAGTFPMSFRNANSGMGTQGQNDRKIYFWQKRGQGRIFIFCDWGIGGLHVLSLADKMMWQPWVLRKLVHGDQAFSGIG